MRISDWSSDVCSSDLQGTHQRQGGFERYRVFLVHERDLLVHHPDTADRQLHRHRKHRDPLGLGRVQEIGELVASVPQIGSGSCRERVGQYVWISVVDVSVTKKKKVLHDITTIR